MSRVNTFSVLAKGRGSPSLQRALSNTVHPSMQIDFDSSSLTCS